MVMQVARTLNEHISKFLEVTLEGCAYAGSGDVLRVQQLLALCGEHIEAEESSPWKVTAANTVSHLLARFQARQQALPSLSMRYFLWLSTAHRAFGSTWQQPCSQRAGFHAVCFAPCVLHLYIIIPFYNLLCLPWLLRDHGNRSVLRVFCGC